MLEHYERLGGRGVGDTYACLCRGLGYKELVVRQLAVTDKRWGGDIPLTPGHALLAIGVEKDRNNDITKILCLDPGFPRPKCAIWNSYIEVTRSPKSDKPFKYVREDRDIKVCLDDMLIIDGE